MSPMYLSKLMLPCTLRNMPGLIWWMIDWSSSPRRNFETCTEPVLSVISKLSTAAPRLASSRLSERNTRPSTVTPPLSSVSSDIGVHFVPERIGRPSRIFSLLLGAFLSSGAG